MKRRISYKRFYISLLLLYIICLPLNAINLGSWGAALKIFAILPVCVALFGGERIRLGAPTLMQMLFTVFAFFSLIWTAQVDESTERVISYALLLALLMSGAAFSYTEEDVQKIKQALVWSSRLTAAVMLIFAEYIDGRFQLTGTIDEDPNYLCAYLAFGVVYAIGVLTEKTTIKKKLISVLELIIYFYLTLVSGSRGGLLAIAAGAGAFLVVCRHGNAKNILKKVVLVSLAFGVMILLIDLLPENLRERFTVENVAESGGSGRVDLWKQAVDLFKNSSVFRQFFGYGTATIRWCFRVYGYHIVNVVHNMFLETLVELGIIGLIIYSAAIFAFIKAAYKFADKYAFSVMLSMLVMSLSTSIYTFKPYFNIMLFIIILQNMQKSCRKQEVQDDQHNNPSIQCGKVYRRMY